jgi:hypothetical protein
MWNTLEVILGCLLMEGGQELSTGRKENDTTETRAGI